MLDEMVFKELRPIVLGKVIKILKNEFYAEDVTQEILKIMWEKRHKIKPQAAITYAMKAIDSQCNKHFNKQNRYVRVDFEDAVPYYQQALQNDLENKKTPAEVDPRSEYFKKHIKPFLSVKEKKLLRTFEEEGSKYIKLANASEISYDAAKKRINRLTGKIWTKYYRYLGMIGSILLLDDSLKSSFRYFFNKSCICFANNELHKLSHYYKKGLKKEDIPDIRVKRFLKYDVYSPEENIYELWAYYRDDNDEYRCYIIEFKKVKKNNSIRITKLPKFPRKISIYRKKDIDKDTLDEITEVVKEKGLLKLNKVQIKKKLDKYKPYKVVTFEDNNDKNETDDKNKS
jgi:DNA-directed RNA polymerase specialized sigma24 family protein